jgi:hypothetical protein
MKGKPIILGSESDPGDLLDRIEAKSEEGRDESWLQALIHQHPEILPAADFDDVYAPAIPIGREIATPSGFIDNLFASPSGAITIVETKLWTNPERHRTVVAQIIDYAKELSRWSFDDLNSAVLKAARRGEKAEPESLDQLIVPYLEDAGMTTVDFQERIISTLRNGEFLLLIIGDVISPNLALLTESISGVPGLDFRLGLIELQLYRLEKGKDWPLLVVPEIVGRTVERIRGVIKVQYVQEKPKLDIEVDEEEVAVESKGKTTKKVFLQKAPSDLAEVYSKWLDEWQERDVLIYWGVEGFSLRVRVDGNLQTIIDAYPEWAVAIVRDNDKERLRLSEPAYEKYKASVRPVDKAAEVLRAGKKYVKHEFLTAEDLMILLQAVDELVDAVVDRK